MDKDKQIQKIQIRSIEELGKKSGLATRALTTLGLKKEKKRFTTIYPCQFCGRLINYALTPCIFCGNYPKTKKEVVVAHLLSSSSLVELNSILGVSRAVKDHADLDVVIGNFREIVDEILENENKYPNYMPLFRMVELSAENKNQEKLKGSKYIERNHITCGQCGSDLFLANKPCYNCGLQNQDNEEYSVPDNILLPIEKQLVAMNNFLLFIENYLWNAEDEVCLEELTFLSVYIINRLVKYPIFRQVVLKIGGL